MANDALIELYLPPLSRRAGRRCRAELPLYLSSVTFQCPPLSGPMRVNLAADLNSRVARSMVRSDFPSRVAISGIESSGVSLSKCRAFPDVFPVSPEPARSPGPLAHPGKSQRRMAR